MRREGSLVADFLIGNFRVDVSRAQIVLKDDITSLEPRVLKVLLILAETPGEVVTHDTLLERAWPNVVVAPNAVQRCIGQLRKALGDDAKRQQVIATHPKVGYSLVAKVQQLEVTQKPANSIVQQPQITKPYSTSILLVGIIALVVVVFYFIFMNKETLPINQLTPLTRTEAKEYYPNFSPDGRYVVFNRYVNVCENELWVKDLAENSEFKVTKNAGYYDSAAWSPDGNQLAFTSVGGCSAKKLSDRCRSISAVSFVLAKTEPQVPRKVLACDEFNYYAINWLGNNEIAYLELEERQRRVKSLTVDSGETRLLYSDPELNPSAITYSANKQKLAITVRDSMQNTSMVLLNTTDNSTEHLKLKIPNEYSDYIRWDPIWHPNNDTFITSAENSLFEIDMAGNFTEHTLSTVDDVNNPNYHPSGDKIVAVMGEVDLDVEEYLLPKINNDLAKKTESESRVIHHSTVEDYDAKYQPNANGIAFISKRSGSQQIWLVENDKLKQLSKFAKNTRISSYQWSLDGKSLALAIKGKLKLLTLDGQAKTITTTDKVIDVYQWFSKQKLLLSVIDQDEKAGEEKQRKIVLFDINTGEQTTVYQGFSYWAQLDNKLRLFYTDWTRKLHLYQDKLSTRIQASSEVQVTRGFILKESQLALFDRSKLWLYDIESQLPSWVELPESSARIAKLADIDYKNGRALFTTYINFKSDLILFER